MSTLIKTVVLDDEIPAMNLISSFVKKVGFLDLKLNTTNPIEALDYIAENSVDLVFLDIQMPDINGIDIAKQMDKDLMVIFTTAYSEYALKGYELDVVDYLLKPIPFDRFQAATDKAHKYFLSKEQNKPKRGAYMFVNADYMIRKIAFNDILYIEGVKDYVKIVTIRGTIMPRMNLKGVLQLLPTDFIRVHKSYIVSFEKIDAFQKAQLLIGETVIPIGESYKDDLFDRIK